MPRRLRLDPAFTVALDGDAGAVWLVAGEDVRYRLGAAEPGWLRDLLAACDGARPLDELVTAVPVAHRDDARAILDQLAEERVLVDATAQAAHVATAAPRFAVTGAGALAVALRDGLGEARAEVGAADVIEVVVQDALDHRALLARNAELLAARRRWMWITSGPGGRAYVGPLFVPDAGPCAACLLVHFKRLSPVPALYDVLLAHDGPIAPSRFPGPAVAVTAALAWWKLGLVAAPLAPAALYALHVVEIADLTISSHVPLIDPECAACR